MSRGDQKAGQPGQPGGPAEPGGEAIVRASGAQLDFSRDMIYGDYLQMRIGVSNGLVAGDPQPVWRAWNWRNRRN